MTTVRLARLDDADAIAHIYNEGIADRVATFETELRTPEQLRASLAARGDRGRRGVLRVRGAGTADAATMPSDPPKNGGEMERSADWMRKALSDLEHARNDIRSDFYEWACFSAQQSAEKAVKAVLQKIGTETWGHSVADLLGELERVRAIPADVMDPARELDKAYIPARYPNAHPAGFPGGVYTRGEADRLVGHAERIVVVCQGLLETL